MTHEHTCGAGREPLGVAREGRRRAGKTGSLGLRTQATTYRTDKQALLHSRGSHARHPVTGHNGKGGGKERSGSGAALLYSGDEHTVSRLCFNKIKINHLTFIH